MRHAQELIANIGLYGFLGTGWFVNWFNPQTFKSDILFIGGLCLIILQCIHQIVKIRNEKKNKK